MLLFPASSLLEEPISILLYGYRSAQLLHRKLRFGSRVAKVTGSAAVITKWEGGAGGIDRAVSTMVKSIERHGFDVDVFTEKRMPPSHYSIPSSEHVSVHVVDEKTAPTSLDQYDLVYVFPYYTQSIWRRQLSSTRAFTVGLGGLPFTGLPSYALFDLVHFESPASRRWVLRAIVAPPDTSYSGPLAHELPPLDVADGGYYLTVFNPWGPIKGLDDMQSFLDTSEIPVVWCYDEMSLEAQGILDNRELIDRVAKHKQVRLGKNLRIDQIHALYQHCLGYVCFSKSESFGWALADAITFKKPICARRTGVLSYFPGFLETTNFSRPVFCRVDRDSSERFSKDVIGILLG